jgi:hypothetical protein
MRRIKHARGKGGTTYKQEQIRTEPADLANTILKMANKRAKMAMVLNVTAASDCFAQDLEDMDDALRDHLTRHEGDEQVQADQPATPPTWPDEAFAKQLPKFRKAIADGKKVEEIIAWAETKGALTEAQKAAIVAPVEAAAAPSYADVAGKLTKAATREALDLAADLIKSVADEKQRNELTALYTRRSTELPE